MAIAISACQFLPDDLNNIVLIVHTQLTNVVAKPIKRYEI
jgi:hypothetical protein